MAATPSILDDVSYFLSSKIIKITKYLDPPFPNGSKYSFAGQTFCINPHLTVGCVPLPNHFNHTIESTEMGTALIAHHF